MALLFVGRLTAGKRPDRFVALVERLRAQGLAVSARMIGEGPMRPALEARSARAGIDMLGWYDDVVAPLQEADVLVFTSAPDGEGMPGVLIEAGLCGLPAVATRVAGASSVIEHGQTGLLVEVDDLDGLVRSTAELVQHPQRLAAMGAAARDRCQRRFSLHAVAQQWDDLLRRAPARQRRSDRIVESEDG
jgi:glycosyltransferase involved in cell wall biosynthesis